MNQAVFGRPERTFVRGGTHISVYLVPVFEGSLVTFEVEDDRAAGTWLPWDLLPWRGNPYVTASELADDWCGGRLTDLRLVDVISNELDDEAWELALVYRAQLTAFPQGDEHREPSRRPHGQIPPVGPFQPIDIERWIAVADAAAGNTRSPGGGLVF